MENASKALLMAAGVLIGLMVLSLAVYLFVSFGTTSAKMHKQNEESQIAQFNSQFTKYEGKDDVTIYDIVTVANLAKENNSYYELDSSNRGVNSTNYIAVKIGTTPIEAENSYQSYINADIANLDGVQSLPTYTCNVEKSSITGRVYIVTFSN